MPRNTPPAPSAPKPNGFGATEVRRLLADYVAATAPPKLVALLGSFGGPDINIPAFVNSLWQGLRDTGVLALADALADLERELKGVPRG